MTQEQSSQSASLSIGAMARATGVPVETLRTWERRYGFPKAERTQTGHRRYSLSSVKRIQMVAKAIHLGHRASLVVEASESELLELIRITPFETSSPPPSSELAFSEESFDSPLEKWIEHTILWDSIGLERDFLNSWNKLGALRFIQECCAPFLDLLGNGWAEGKLGVSQEHFASEKLREFLTGQWRRSCEFATGPKVICATLPGEQHTLGLHMAATVVSQTSHHVLFLGANTPVGELIECANHTNSTMILISASVCFDPEELAHHLRQLVLGLPQRVRLVGGGKGFDPLPTMPSSNAQVIQDFGVLYEECLQGLRSWH
jgi:MerR family transcriptional regulator, light-induced transcriptional regulator